MLKNVLLAAVAATFIAAPAYAGGDKGSHKPTPPAKSWEKKDYKKHVKWTPPKKEEVKKPGHKGYHPKPTGENVSDIVQDGTNNEAAVGQTGYKNISIIDQAGKENRATHVQNGYKNVADTLQDGEKNSSEVTQNGAKNDALVTQIGKENKSTIDQDGYKNEAEVLQVGTKNDSSIEQSGSGNKATVVQSNYKLAAK